MDDLKIRSRKVGSALVVSFTGNFDYDMDNLSEEFMEDLFASQYKVVVLDLKKAKKAASAFINRLVKILRIAEMEKGRLYLMNVPENVIKVLSMVNIIGRFSFFRTEEDLKAVYGEGKEFSEAEPDRRIPTLKIYKALEGCKHVFNLQGSFVEGANTALLIEDVKCSLNQGAESITLDFEKVEVMDTLSVGLLLSLHKMGEARGVPIVITSANDIVAHVLHMNDVGKMFGL